MKGAKVRLHLEHSLGQGQSLSLSREQAHYLFNVMRLAAGDAVLVFNGEDGEWRAEVAEAGKRGGVLTCVARTAAQRNPPDIWLLFAPIKKARTDFIVEKATELGVARILPILTDFTNSERVRRDRLQAHAKEAAEQCGGTYVPQIEDVQRLSDVLQGWPLDRALIFCDEGLAGETAFDMPPPPAAILIGPEGGFSGAERQRLGEMAGPVALGPRILRSDTAAVVALALWQSSRGDWT